MIKKIRNLNLGTQRLIFVGSFTFAILVQYLLSPQLFGQFDSVDFWTEIFVIWVGYWALAILIIWIISSSKETD
jgi:hypothetical protein